MQFLPGLEEGRCRRDGHNCGSGGAAGGPAVSERACTGADMRVRGSWHYGLAVKQLCRPPRQGGHFAPFLEMAETCGIGRLYLPRKKQLTVRCGPGICPGRSFQEVQA